MSANPDTSKVLSFEDARRVVEHEASLVRAGETETLELLASAVRVLAGAIFADRDIPPFPRSTRDGYAVYSGDLSKLPATLEVIGEIKAGEKLENIPATIARGQTASIMTGAPVPGGADAVVMVEYTSQHGQQVEITRQVVAGENIVPRGSEAQQGSLLIPPGTPLTDAAIALAASAGNSKLQVYKRPRVGVLTTGDEIVAIDTLPGPTQIRNSNSYSLAVQVHQAGGDPILLPIAPDEPGRLRELIEEGLNCDLLLMTGGVSMGRYDLVEQVLSEMRAEFFFTGAKIQQAGLRSCEAQVGNQSQAWPQTFSSRNALGRIRKLSSRARALAGLWRHRRHRSRQLLRRHRARPRAHLRRRVGSGDDPINL